MELNTILVGSIILLAMFVPIVYMIMNASGSDKKAKKSLSKLASSKNISLNEIEVHGNVVFGLNENSKHFVFSYKTDVAANFKEIDLKTIKSSQVKTTYVSEKSLETVILELNGKENFSLIFYDDNDDDNHSIDPEIALQNARDLENKIRVLL